MITVDANLFRLAYAAVAVDEMRPYLKGVCIEPHPVKGAIMVSTMPIRFSPTASRAR